MAKSQETYGKKEKEKKRLQKRKEKEEKKQERKANNNKGKSFDDMIGYVDAYGRLSDTPPDPSKRIEVKLEDLQLGATKREEPDPSELIRTGMVTMYNDEKGYGFIKDLKTQDSYFVHYKSLQQPIKLNDKVTFEIEMGQKGPVAARVSLVIA
ncbi:MAG: cold shock domain-containing protein [Flavobacteriales bacterium]|nr:cold shock domain-containing protein [Flavobacteriales bacterium]